MSNSNSSTAALMRCVPEELKKELFCLEGVTESALDGKRKYPKSVEFLSMRAGIQRTYIVSTLFVPRGASYDIVRYEAVAAVPTGFSALALRVVAARINTRPTRTVSTSPHWDITYRLEAYLREMHTSMRHCTHGVAMSSHISWIDSLVAPYFGGK